MIRLVKIVHPEAGETEVPESSVRVWRRAGWKPADEVEAPTDVPPANKPADKESKASGRSRQQPDKESE